ncbi:glucose-1-phosphate adenylyltransferase small subunit, chloroplastic/amyloplastic-like isoform X2 [Durio zibethinus]|uniref:glucose-1-phosphate adenylyltransferase n=1 Tax=Durio zibethinus TaxID=66656 RepID=A0A6P5ZL32_DURZI|nr:glucose-1-phosphate adenylyltransferase small subunit, chloroplastic/amyloplastic-like isoform X2 [Durio zibethinus]XP_022753491.1 glucose-1-phosphate adenylyltransferase small subunit, chloroplastic/amyloplastic-like isoform X2 [Durio zibethinus]
MRKGNGRHFYNMGGYKNEGFVEVLAAQQSLENPNWFQGTASAVRQYLWLLKKHNVLEFLILVWDHLYKMDYETFIQAQRETDADIIVTALPMDKKQATAYGQMKIDEGGRIIEFTEKLKGEQLKAMLIDTTILGLDDERAKEIPFIASMDKYGVSKDVMLNLLPEKYLGANDFESEDTPGATSIGMRVQVYLYDCYWEDIGTIGHWCQISGYSSSSIFYHLTSLMINLITFYGLELSSLRVGKTH